MIWTADSVLGTRQGHTITCPTDFSFFRPYLQLPAFPVLPAQTDWLCSHAASIFITTLSSAYSMAQQPNIGPFSLLFFGFRDMWSCTGRGQPLAQPPNYRTRSPYLWPPETVAQLHPNQWVSRDLWRATSRTHSNCEPNTHIYQHGDRKYGRWNDDCALNWLRAIRHILISQCEIVDNARL